MAERTNEQLVRETWDAVGNHDIDTFLANLADDVTWTFFGSHKFAGTFNGKEDLLTRLLEPINGVIENGIRLDIRELHCDGPVVIVEAKGEARSTSGLEYNNDYCLVITCNNDKIQHVREYLDSELVTEVFGK